MWLRSFTLLIQHPLPLIPRSLRGIDVGVNVLAALTSNKPGFLPRLVNGRPLKAVNQLYNKHREHEQKKRAKGSVPRFTSRFAGVDHDEAQ